MLPKITAVADKHCRQSPQTDAVAHNHCRQLQSQTIAQTAATAYGRRSRSLKTAAVAEQPTTMADVRSRSRHFQSQHDDSTTPDSCIRRRSSQRMTKDSCTADTYNLHLQSADSGHRQPLHTVAANKNFRQLQSQTINADICNRTQSQTIVGDRRSRGYSSQATAAFNNSFCSHNRCKQLQ